MNTAIKIIVLGFMLFLSTPTIVSVLEGNCDTTSLFNNMSEEELVHGKEVIDEIIVYTSYEFINLAPFTKGAIQTYEPLRTDLLEEKILIPPPERV